jgi:hypothetical protein
MFCYFLGFFEILDFSSVFFVECPKKVLGKEWFVDKMFAEYPWPSVKRHSTKNASPLVIVATSLNNQIILN